MRRCWRSAAQLLMPASVLETVMLRMPVEELAAIVMFTVSDVALL
jgi:hypothetical protein